MLNRTELFPLGGSDYAPGIDGRADAVACMTIEAGSRRQRRQRQPKNYAAVLASKASPSLGSAIVIRYGNVPANLI